MSPILKFDSVFSSVGPDAVTYVVNHADVQAIFCVPQTLNTVSFIFASLKLCTLGELGLSRDECLNWCVCCC